MLRLAEELLRSRDQERYHIEAEGYYQTNLTRLEIDPGLRAKTLKDLAQHVFRAHQNNAEATRLSEQALELQFQDDRLRARILANMADYLYLEDSLDRIIACYQTALNLPFEDCELRAELLIELGNNYKWRGENGDLERAIHHYRQAIGFSLDPLMIGRAWRCISQVLRLRNPVGENLDEAIRCCDRSILALQGTNDQFLLSLTYQELVMVLRMRNRVEDLARAIRCLEEIITLNPRSQNVARARAQEFREAIDRQN